MFVDILSFCILYTCYGLFCSLCSLYTARSPTRDYDEASLQLWSQPLIPLRPGLHIDSPSIDRLISLTSPSIEAILLYIQQTAAAWYQGTYSSTNRLIPVRATSRSYVSSFPYPQRANSLIFRLRTATFHSLPHPATSRHYSACAIYRQEIDSFFPLALSLAPCCPFFECGSADTLSTKPTTLLLSNTPTPRGNERTRTAASRGSEEAIVDARSRRSKSLGELGNIRT